MSDVASAAWGYVRRAPGTFVWLAILFVTTVVMHHLSPQVLHDVLGDRSTNLHHLREDPIRVLVTSAFWIAGGTWIGYFLLFNLFHAPVERWLGTWRWLSVAVIAHVGATYISEGVLYLAIQHHRAPESAVNTLDVGVSYALAGVTAVLAYRIAPPWRYVYVVGVLLVYGLPCSVGSPSPTSAISPRCSSASGAIRSPGRARECGIRRTGCAECVNVSERTGSVRAMTEP